MVSITVTTNGSTGAFTAPGTGTGVQTLTIATSGSYLDRDVLVEGRQQRELDRQAHRYHAGGTNRLHHREPDRDQAVNRVIDDRLVGRREPPLIIPASSQG